DDIDRWAHVLVPLPVRFKQHLAAYRVKLPLQIVDAPAIEGERHDAVLPIELGDLPRDGARVCGRSNRHDETELRPRGVGRTILLATFLQIARKPTVRLHMKHTRTVLIDDYQSTQIASGAEIQSSVDASAGGNVGLSGAGTPCGSINEPRFCCDALV